MSALLDRLRKSRERVVDVESGRIKLTIRRPAELDYIHMIRAAEADADIARQIVVGWSGVVESDIVSSGGDVEVAFDAALCADWIADRPGYWGPIMDALAELRTQLKSQQEALEKN